MRKYLLAAGIAAAALIPTFALAQQSCEQQHENRVAGTVAGAGIGALLGAAIAGRHNTGAGVVVGGLSGAVVGNQLTRPNADCAHAYGYYDSNGLWHANVVARGYATGYYDRSGAWVDGAPNGYYDGQGRWIAAGSTADASGYYDRDGRWVPASAAGYYDDQGRWTAPEARDRGSDAAYESASDWGDARPGVRAHEVWLERRIQSELSNGTLSQSEADQALRPLDSIRRQEMSRRGDDGRLSPRDETYFGAELDNLNNSTR
jgi:hypothetical protein